MSVDVGTLIACVVVIGGTIVVGIAVVAVLLISKFKKALKQGIEHVSQD